MRTLSTDVEPTLDDVYTPVPADEPIAAEQINEGPVTDEPVDEESTADEPVVNVEEQLSQNYEEAVKELYAPKPAGEAPPVEQVKPAKPPKAPKQTKPVENRQPAPDKLTVLQQIKLSSPW